MACGQFALSNYINVQSSAYRYGEYAGEAAMIALTLLTPYGGVIGLIGKTVFRLNFAAGLVNAGEAFLQGKTNEGLFHVGMAVLSLSLSLSPSQWGGLVSRYAGPTAGGAAKWLARGAMAIGPVTGVYQAGQRFSNGDIVGGFLSLGQAAASAYAATRSCFTGDMLLDTEEGKKRADQIKVGDRLWSRPEDDPDGPLALKEVEEVFVRVAPVLNLHVAGQIIRTTCEHPFWVENKRVWLPAGALEIGDLVRTRGGMLVPVQGVADSGEVATVYNWRISEFHTYYVSATEIGVSIWAHNTTYTGSKQQYEVRLVDGKYTLYRVGARKPVQWDASSNKTGARTFDNRQQATAHLKKINAGARPDVELPSSRQRSSKRREYMGQNPKKGSETYTKVLDRMRKDGEIVKKGNKEYVKNPDGSLTPLKKADLTHRRDAVDYWNKEGKYWGPKHDKVREWMTDPNNYTLGPKGANRSAGAKLKETYEPPDPRPTGPPPGRP